MKKTLATLGSFGVAGAVTGLMSSTVIGLSIVVSPVVGIVAARKLTKNDKGAPRFLKTVGITSAAWFGFIIPACLVSEANSPVLYTPDPYPTSPSTKVEAAPVNKWKNPNIKPFAESPFMDYGKVEWDEDDQQWRCEFAKGSTTPCSKAEGKTAEQLKEDGAQARVDTARFRAEREAQERALNEYWCGPFEDPKKTGCNSL
jgi:hypothetical protein